MSKEDQIIDRIPDEQNDYYSNDDLYKITSWGADLSFRELITQYQEGDLAKPELQRHYVWDKTEASRFIDSILLGLPIPSIFLAKTIDEKMLIIDGYQRIMTVHNFVTGIFSGDGKVFKLSNSEKINKRWRGKAFNELQDSEQRKIRNTTIHAIIFIQKEPNEDDTSMYQVFERINTGGRSLFPQEIRNCVYQGKFNTLLMKLNTNSSWRSLYGLSNPDSRMRDVEFILRFFALRSGEILKGDGAKQISLKKFLNEFMGSSESRRQDILDAREDIFLKTVETVLSLFGDNAFHNISPKEPDKFIRKFNPTIFDSIMISTSLAFAVNKHCTINVSHGEKRVQLLLDREYQELIKVRTTDIDRIQARIRMALSYLYDCRYEDVV